MRGSLSLYEAVGEEKSGFLVEAVEQEVSGYTCFQVFPLPFYRSGHTSLPFHFEKNENGVVLSPCNAFRCWFRLRKSSYFAVSAANFFTLTIGGGGDATSFCLISGCAGSSSLNFFLLGLLGWILLTSKVPPIKAFSA